MELRDRGLTPYRACPRLDALLERSRFERGVINTLAREKLRLAGEGYTPTGMQGWSRVVFRRDSDGEERTMHLEDLLEHLHTWGRRH
jgi:hypothetical protein